MRIRSRGISAASYPTSSDNPRDLWAVIFSGWFAVRGYWNTGTLLRHKLTFVSEGAQDRILCSDGMPPDPFGSPPSSFNGNARAAQHRSHPQPGGLSASDAEMLTPHLSKAPSSMAMRGVLRSPINIAFFRMSILSRTSTSPSTRPTMIASRVPLLCSPGVFRGYTVSMMHDTAARAFAVC